MKRRRNTHSNHERWLVSYADFITLLFAFFVVLYASAEIDKKKVGQLSESIQTAFQEMGAFSTKATRSNAELKQKTDGLTSTEMARLQAELTAALSAEIARKEIAIHVGPDGLVVSLRELGFFDSGSAHIRPQARAAFQRIVTVLKERPYSLRIEGHTDNVPIHNERFASNWELSTARATEVVRVLVTEHNFPPATLAAAGYGEFHPMADNTTLEGRQNNRRVDIVVFMATNFPHK